MFHNIPEFVLVLLMCADVSWVVGDEELVQGIYTSVRRNLGESIMYTPCSYPGFFVLIIKFRTYLVRS